MIGELFVDHLTFCTEIMAEDRVLDKYRVVSKAIDIPTPHGAMDGYAAHPGIGARYPLVILFMDIWGLRDELFAIARRIAAQGYYCIVPNLFYREGKFRYEQRDGQGRMMSFSTLPDPIKQDMRARAQRLNRQTAYEDVSIILDFARHEPVRDGPAGSIGFCMGGREAFCTGQAFAGRFCATASLHGTRLVTAAEDSPHRLTHKMRGEVYCGFAEIDQSAPPEYVRALNESLQSQPNLTYRRQMHIGAHHGYAFPDRDVHDHAAAESDWREIFGMFERQLSA